jgi:hypothetical protein
MNGKNARELTGWGSCAVRPLHVVTTGRFLSRAFAFLLFAMVCCNVSATTNTVTSLNDNGPGTLRQVIADSVDGDTIIFYANGTITLTNGELVITNSLTISGPGAAILAVSGNSTSRVFNISNSSATVTMSGVTIRDGKAPDGAAGTNEDYTNNIEPTAGGVGSDGGGIFNAGNLVLNYCVVTSNTAGGGGIGGSGGLAGEPGGNGGNGGGIYSIGPCTLNTCTVSSNAAGSGVGGVAGGYGASTGGSGGCGGGVCGPGLLTMNDCTFSGNTAGRGGNGGSSMSQAAAPGAAGCGGGVYSANLCSMTACTFWGNAAGVGGRDGQNFGGGGGGGPGGHGGGIFNAGVLTLTACTFSANTGGPGSTGPGSAHGGSGGTGGNGGGIFNTGILTLTACTLSANSGGPGGSGAGAYAPGGNGGNGGGIYNSTNATTAVLRSSLIGTNMVGVGGPGGFDAAWNRYYGPTGSVGVGSDLYGAFTSQGFNLLGQSEGSTGLVNGVSGDLVGTAAAPIDPLLGPLADNGGPTLTMALLSGSPAIATGDYSLTGTDQRGLPRSVNGTVDIGAYESQQPFVTLIVTTPYGNASPAGTTHNYMGSFITAAITNSPVVDGTTQYVCVGWVGTGSVPASGGGTSTDPFAITNDSSITWLWTTNYLLSITTNGNGSVDVGSGWCSSGANLVVTATPGAGVFNRFTGWSGDTNGCAVNSNQITILMDRPRVVTARFARQCSLSVATPYGQANPPVGTNWFDYGSSNSVTITNSPVISGGTQYVCRGWTGTGNTPKNGTTTNAGPFAITTNSTVTWLWRTNYWLDVACSGAGSVTTNDCWLANGTNLHVTATPSNHWHFTQWSGDTSGCTIKSNKITMVMNMARTITAVFDRNQAFGVDLGVRSNRFGFTIIGTSNLVVVVEACTDLLRSAWSPVSTNTLTGGSSYFSDSGWKKNPHRFYRIKFP